MPWDTGFCVKLVTGPQSLYQYGPVWRLIEDLRMLSVYTDTACLPMSHNSPCVLYVEVLEAIAKGSSTGDKLS